MKFRFLFLIIVLLFAVAPNVCATENNSEDFPQYKLFVWMKNGERCMGQF